MMKADQFTPKPDLTLGRYEHYKGNYYEVINLGCHTETHEWFVVYRSLYDPKDNPDTWIRPYEMFIENVTIEGEVTPRFKKVEETQ